MAKTPLILLTASLLLALTFTVSCSENGEDGDPSSSSVNDVNGESSSSIIANGDGNNLSSSSVSGGSSSSAATGAGNSSSSSSVNGESSSSKTTNREGNFEGDIFTESYALRNVTDDSFEYIETYEDDYCIEGGNVVIEENYENPRMVNYSINNNILIWKYRWDDDSLHFAGTSDNIMGAWTRTKDKNNSCKFKTYGENTYPSCTEGWDIVKAEFATSTVKITSDVCVTDEVNGINEGGWKYTATDCNSFEISKGAEKVTAIVTLSNGKFASLTEMYKDKTCAFEGHTISMREKACKKAWDEYHLTDTNWDRYYFDFVWDDYDKCIEQNGFPVSTFGDHPNDGSDGDSIGAVSAKPLPKKKHGNRVVTPGLRLLGPL